MRQLAMFIILFTVSLPIIVFAQLCTPNMTAEQAFLSLKNPTQTTITATNSTANPLSNLPKLININTATEAELTQLDGIGAKKAQDIILYRDMIAPFASIDDLDKVKGIGKATIDKNRNRITVR